MMDTTTKLTLVSGIVLNVVVIALAIITFLLYNS